MIPTTEECLEILKQFEVPEPVVNHCLIVNKIAMMIVCGLEKNNVMVNKELVNAATILHDIMKLVSKKSHDFNLSISGVRRWEELRQKYKDLNHAEAGYIELKDRYPEIALLIRKHIRSYVFKSELKTIEEKIVYLSDKYVKGEEVMTLEEGMKRFKAKYDVSDEKLQDVYDIEQEIFSQIDITPEEVIKEVA